MLFRNSRNKDVACSGAVAIQICRQGLHLVRQAHRTLDLADAKARSHSLRASNGIEKAVDLRAEPRIVEALEQLDNLVRIKLVHDDAGGLIDLAAAER